ncbi:MAG: hypothetical protein AB7F89_08960 [Pirellulaceae bacterium]
MIRFGKGPGGEDLQVGTGGVGESPGTAPPLEGIILVEIRELSSPRFVTSPQLPSPGTSIGRFTFVILLPINSRFRTGDWFPKRGDFAVIDGLTQGAAEGVKKDHLDGHLAMYDGTQWISDFAQTGQSPYPGSDYEIAKPKVVIYR